VVLHFRHTRTLRRFAPPSEAMARLPLGEPAAEIGRHLLASKGKLRVGSSGCKRTAARSQKGSGLRMIQSGATLRCLSLVIFGKSRFSRCQHPTPTRALVHYLDPQTRPASSKFSLRTSLSPPCPYCKAVTVRYIYGFSCSEISLQVNLRGHPAVEPSVEAKMPA